MILVGKHNDYVTINVPNITIKHSFWAEKGKNANVFSPQPENNTLKLNSGLQFETIHLDQLFATSFTNQASFIPAELKRNKITLTECSWTDSVAPVCEHLVMGWSLTTWSLWCPLLHCSCLNKLQLTSHFLFSSTWRCAAPFPCLKKKKSKTWWLLFFSGASPSGFLSLSQLHIKLIYVLCVHSGRKSNCLL